MCWWMKQMNLWELHFKLCDGHIKLLEYPKLIAMGKKTSYSLPSSSSNLVGETKLDA